MSKNFSLGKIFGVQIIVNYSWLIIYFLVAWSFAVGILPSLNPNRPEIFYILLGLLGGILLFASVLIHELMHTLVARANGVKIEKIVLFLFGGAAELPEEPATAKTEIKMAAAGPIASFAIGLILIAISLPLLKVFPRSLWPSFFLTIGLINLSLTAFILLPGFPLDGGRILRGIIWWRTKDLLRATKTAANIGQIIAYLIIVGGVIQVFIGGFLNGLWLILIGLFLNEAAQYTFIKTIASSVLRTINAEEIMDENFSAVDAKATVKDFISLALKKRKSNFIVRKNRRLVGLIVPNALKKLNGNDGDKKLEEIMIKAADLERVDAQEPAVGLLNLLQKSSPVMVFKNGRLVGLVTPEDIEYYLKFRVGNL